MPKQSKKRSAKAANLSKSTEVQPVAKKSKKAEKQAVEKVPESEFDNDLEIFSRLEKKPEDLPKIIEDLKTLLLDSGDKAMNELLIFTLDSMGCTEYTLKLDKTEPINLDDVMEKIQKSKLQVVLSDVPLIGKNKNWKTFRRDFPLFWSSFIKNVAYEILVDSSFLKIYVKLMVKYLSSKLRAMRYSCNETLLSIFAALSEVHSSYVEEIKICGELATEAKNTKQRRAVESTKKDHSKILAKTESLLDLIYEELYLKRSYDTMVDIRQRILESLFSIETLLPTYFNKKETGELIQKFLLDEDASLVKTTIELLKKSMAINQHDSAKNKLIHNLKSTLWELSTNADSSIAEKALLLINQNSDKLKLTEDELKKLGSLVFYPALCVARPAAALVNTVYFESSLIQAKLADDDQLPFIKEKEESEQQLLKLAEIFQDYTLEDPNNSQWSDCFIKAFIESTCVFFDIETIFDIVKRNIKSKSSSTTNPSSRILLRLLNSAVAQALVMQSRRPLYDKQLLQVTNKCLDNIVAYFSINMLKMVTDTKLETEAGLLFEILSLFDKLKIDLLTGAQSELPYEDICNCLKDVIIRTRNKEVVPVICRFFAIVLKYRVSLEKNIKTMTTELEASVKDIIYSSFEKLQVLTSDQALLSAIDIALFKYHQTAVYFELKSVQNQEFVLKVADVATYLASNVNPVPHKAIISCLNILFYTHLWAFSHVFKKPESLDEYQKMRELLVSKLIEFLDTENLRQLFASRNSDIARMTSETRSAIGSIQEKSFSLLVELLSVILSNKFRSVNYLEFSLSKKRISPLKSFIETPDLFDNGSYNWNVFSTETKKMVEEVEKITEITYDKGEPSSDHKADQKGFDSPSGVQDRTLDTTIATPHKIEKLEYTCSLFCKLLMASNKVLEQDNFVAPCFVLYYKHANESIKQLLKTLLLKIVKNDNEIKDIIKVICSQETEINATELIKNSLKTYFDISTKESPQDQQLMLEKYLRFLVDGISVGLKDQDNHAMLKYMSQFVSKGYVPANDFIKILAFFELEVQKMKDEVNKSNDTEHENQGEEESKDKEQKKTDDGKEHEAIIQFRKILTKMAGIKKVLTDKPTKSRGELSSHKKQSKSRIKDDEDYEGGKRIQLNDIPTISASRKSTRGAGKTRLGLAEPEVSDDESDYVITGNASSTKNVRESETGKKNKKRRAKDNGEGLDKSKFTEEEVKDLKEMAEGSSRASRVRPKNTKIL